MEVIGYSMPDRRVAAPDFRRRRLTAARAGATLLAEATETRGEIAMQSMLMWLGRVAGIAGTLVCLVGGLVRLSGSYWLGGFQAGTLLPAGTAMMTFACLCFLALLAGRDGKG